MSRLSKVCCALLAVVGVLMPGGSGATAKGRSGGGADSDNPNAGVVSPDARYRGMSYDQWVAEFWQWALALPVEGHPFLDENPQYDFAKNQSGKVWFWSAPDGPLTRTATIPEGTAIFLTVRDVEVSSLEEPPFFGETEQEQREQAEWFADHIVDVFVTIDGREVQDVAQFRFQSPQFKFKAPTPWVFGDTGGKGTSVGDGYYLMLEPLPVGHHTIHYGGTFHFEAGELGNDEPFDLPKEITIELTVLPK
jgi:hypothetical protein